MLVFQENLSVNAELSASSDSLSENSNIKVSCLTFPSVIAEVTANTEIVRLSFRKDPCSPVNQNRSSTF